MCDTASVNSIVDKLVLENAKSPTSSIIFDVLILLNLIQPSKALERTTVFLLRTTSSKVLIFAN